MASGLLTGAIVNAVIQKVVDVAGTHLEDYMIGRMGTEEQLRQLKTLLPTIQSVVDAAERGEQQIPDPLREWLQQLKDVLYEADDVVDELEYLQLQQRVEADANRREQLQVPELMSQYMRKATRVVAQVFAPDPALEKLKGVVVRLVEVAAGVGNFVELVSNAKQEFQQQDKQAILNRETGPLLTENKVFGREKERDELLRWLKTVPADHNDESNMGVSLFSVVGHGGMGKTTLAQLVYNDETVQKSFDLKIWVCISTSFDVKGLTRSILEGATKQRPNVDGLPVLQDALKEKLKTSGKFLLVLDDVWKDDDLSNWQKLLAPLKCGRNGSKILLTTRMDGVADMAAKAMEASTRGSLKLGGLHGEDFSSLFNRYAFAGVDHENYPHLQRIGMQIVQKLGNSPLAAKTIGGLLNSKLDERYWRTILDSKNISDQVQPGGDNIMSILKLSYHHLPLHLRPCFAYCAMFPKDHEFRKQDLAHMWMAVGFIQHSDQNQGETLEDVGGDYFDELLRRSLFDHKYIDYYVMHDLLHDLAQTVSHGECYSFVDYDKNVEGIIPGTVRHLYIESDNLDVLTKVDNWHSLHSLVLKIEGAGFEYTSGLEKVFKSLKSIRMLNVDLGWKDVTMPESFSHLIHLRSLKFHSGKLLKFPTSLCKLYHLQAIQFEYSKDALKLPESINKLVNLRHLSANHLVIGVGKLKFLQDLSFFVKKERGYKIGELEELVWLRNLKIEGLENVENQEEAGKVKLCNNKYLQTLYLGWSVSGDVGMDKHELVLDSLQPHSNLKDLTIHGYKGIRYAKWMGFELINNLQCIRLSDCSRLDHLPSLKRLPFLKKFRLNKMPMIKKLDYTCQRLTELSIFCMEGLEELPGSDADVDQWYPHLQFLHIENCPKLEVMPSLSMSIREICLKNVGLASLPTLGLDRSSTCNTSGSLSSSSSLENLEIHDCGKITSLGEGLLQLQHYLITLEHLKIGECPELVDFPSEGLQHLQALRHLYIWNCPKLQVALEAINPDGNDEKFLPPSLQRLQIEGCDKLVRSLPTLLKGLVSLDELMLKDCEDISLEGLMGLQSIGSLEIRGCQKLLHVTGTNTFFTLVECLWIDDPLLLVSGVFRSLTSVRYLHIRKLGGIEDLSILEQWLLQNQTTLENITISRASSLKSLPYCLKILSSRKCLAIWQTSEALMERCRKDEGADWTYISHIPRIIISGPDGKSLLYGN